MCIDFIAFDLYLPVFLIFNLPKALFLRLLEFRTEAKKFIWPYPHLGSEANEFIWSYPNLGSEAKEFVWFIPLLGNISNATSSETSFITDCT